MPGPSFALLLAAFLSGEDPNGGCPEGTVFVEERRTETADAIYIQPICRKVAQPRGQATGTSAYQPYAPGFETDDDFIRAMLALARSQGWASNEVGRAEAALNGLGRSDLPDATDAEIGAIWARMRARSSDRALLAAAAGGQGPRLFRAGWQSGRYGDCAVFALATGTGVPYGVVAARANELLRSAEWRIASDRAQPERVFRLAGGLNGGEVILLGEALGRVAVVPLAQFRKTLAAGQPVLISMSTSSGGAHQVVLSRTFERNGEDWYELVNSQQAGSRGSQFVSHAELLVLAAENGITVQPEPGRVVRPLRK